MKHKDKWTYNDSCCGCVLCHTWQL